MKILITNDDSIDCEGLRILTRRAQQYGAVTVVAPKHEQSAKSHAINVRSGFEITAREAGLGVPSYVCDSTPADAVRAAKYGLGLDFEIVFSGINNGFNLGEDILYSGTVSAAMEAVLMGKKAIAFSVAPGDYASGDAAFDEVMAFILNNSLLECGDLFNVNIPKNHRGIRMTKQGNTNFDTRFEQEESLFFQRGHHRYHLDENEHDDVWAIEHGYISVSPLSADRTDYQALKKILEIKDGLR